MERKSGGGSEGEREREIHVHVYRGRERERERERNRKREIYLPNTSLCLLSSSAIHSELDVMASAAHTAPLLAGSSELLTEERIFLDTLRESSNFSQSPPAREKNMEEGRGERREREREGTCSKAWNDIKHVILFTTHSN